jgi:CRISPR-associated exonuclease Cas4
MFEEDDLLPISALQHLAFCERQWALIHLEQVWQDDGRTAEGVLLHDRAHEPDIETRPGIRVARGLRLRSSRLGLSGQADVVEFITPGAVPFPIEYKRGRPKRGDWDLVQLCAQALCLEEMLGRRVPAGAFFYGKNRRRMQVEFDTALRVRTEQLAARLHQLWKARKTPPPFEPGTRESLQDCCLPAALAQSRNVRRYIQGSIRRMLEEPEE